MISGRQERAVKYDRPVWQIMHACADAMPDVFRYEDVRTWFRAHYPEVNEATIRAHLIGLTEGGRAKHVQFAQRSPVFRRVSRGEYESLPVAERGEDPDVDAPSASKLKMTPVGRTAAKPADAPDAAEQGGAAPDAEMQNREPTAPKAKKTKRGKGKAASKTTRGSTSGAVPAGAEDEAELPAQSAETDEVPLTDDPEPHVTDVVLLGSVGDRVNVPAPAKEIYRDVSFQLSRSEAEVSGSEWFVLSAEHGLVAPNEWMSPDSRTLADMDPDYRVTWASWVVTRLQSLVGSIDEMHVRVDAPDEFVGPLFADLQEAGAVVSSGSFGVTAPPSSSAGGRENAVAQLAEAVAAAADAVGSADTNADDVATLLPIDAGSPVSLHLADHRNAVPATDSSDLPGSPGLYGWFVDPSGARELNRCLMLPVRAGLIFVGQVGGSSWHSLADPVLNLRDHVERIQLHGRSRASTFRMTLATVLRDDLRMTSLEDPRLTEWMLQHLSVSWWSSDNLGELRELEQVVVSELDPPLNVDHLPASQYRARLSQMRSGLA